MPHRHEYSELFSRLTSAVGRRRLLCSERSMRRYARGYRFGNGEALAVVRPATLLELWRVLQACVDANVVIVMQAANTGLTGGSTPRDEGYDRPAIVISTSGIKGIYLINKGEEVVCLPGSTLNELERALTPLGREPHSVIGSSCIGASVIGGICNNSGGALVQRGPAYTELALYARATSQGLELVNELGIALGDEPETILGRLERGEFSDVVPPPCDKKASDRDYGQRVRQVDQPTPARFNNDPNLLCGASGSAGRVAVFAVRLDTFPSESDTATFYIGTNDPAALAALRVDILTRFGALPVSGEYLHREAFDLADKFGKDTFLAVQKIGTGRLPLLFDLKARVDGLAGSLLGNDLFVSDRMLQGAARLFPDHLPRRMRQFRDRFEHHLILKMAGSGIAEARGYLEAHMNGDGADFFECTSEEAAGAFLHRFAVASAAIRYRAIHRASVEGIVSLDIALPRNMADWFEKLPPELESRIVAKIYYGHFFCHVFHQDYLVCKGENLENIEAAILALIDARGCEYPAEHNVGHHYIAKPTLAEFYRRLDPGNRFNPGIGKTSARKDWQ